MTRLSDRSVFLANERLLKLITPPQKASSSHSRALQRMSLSLLGCNLLQTTYC